MKKQFLEAGKIVNTHGLRGEVKIQPWADSGDFLLPFEYFYIDGAPVKVLGSKVHKNSLIAALEGVDNINGAMALKNKIIFIDRNEAKLPENVSFIQDLEGLSVIDADSGEVLGVLSEVLSLPSNEVFVIQGEREYLVPAVPEFIIETNLGEGYVKIRLIDGM